MTCIGCASGCDGSNKALPTGWSSHPLVAGHPSLPAHRVRNRLLMAGKLFKHQPSRLPLGGGGCPRKPQAWLLEKESRLRVPQAGELGPGRDRHPSVLPSRGMSPICWTDGVGGRQLVQMLCSDLRLTPFLS